MRSLLLIFQSARFWLAIVVVFATGLTLPAEAARSNFRKKSKVRVRLVGTLGYLNYASGNATTNVSSALGGAEVRTEIEGFQPQGQLETDLWFSRRVGLLQHFEFMRLDLQGKDTNFQGNSIDMAANYIQLGVRVAGAKGNPAMGSEIVFGVGPEVSHVSDVRSHWDQPQYERVPLTIVGLNMGGRVRLALLKRTAVQVSGGWSFPLSLMGGRGALKAGDSRTIRYSAIYDFAITPGVAIGGGFIGSMTRLSYLPSTQTNTQTIQFLNYGFVGSFLFSF